MTTTQYSPPPPRVTIRCLDEPCLSVTRVYHVPPVTSVGTYKYCPKCGSGNTAVGMDEETSYWEALQERFGLPRQLLEQIYEGFRQQTVYVHYSEYLTHIMRQLAQGLAHNDAQSDATT